MIDKISNLKGITIQTNYLINVSGTSPDSYNPPYVTLKAGGALLFKFIIQSLSSLETICSARLMLYFLTPYVNSEVRVHRVTGVYNPSNCTRMPTYDQTPLYEKGFSATDEEHGMLIDLTALIKDWRENPTAILAIAILPKSSTNLVIATPAYSNLANIECMRIDTSVVLGLESYYNYSTQDIGFAGKGYVNNLSGELLLKFDGISTDSAKIPINFQAYYANRSFLFPDYPNNSLDGNFRSIFDYGITINDDSIKLFAPSGAIGVFDKILMENYSKYDIEEIVPYVFLNFSDYSYLVRSGGTGVTNYVLKTREGNKLSFGLDSSGFWLLRLTKEDDSYIEYAHSTSTGKITSATSYTSSTPVESRQVTIVYDSNGRITTVNFINENKRLLLSYSYENLSQIILQKVIYNISSAGTIITYEEIGKAIYRYVSLHKLYLVGDYYLNIGYDYLNNQNNKITKVTELNWESQTTGQFIDLSYYNSYTKITNFDNEFCYLYFDDYGTLLQSVNKFGDSESTNYISAGFEGVSRKPSNTSNIIPSLKNAIVDHSFEISNDSISSNSIGWQTNNISNVKVIDGGVYGEKYLAITKSSSTTTNVYQTIRYLKSGTYKLVFLAKAPNITGQSRVKVDVLVTVKSYDVDESNYIGEDENGRFRLISNRTTYNSVYINNTFVNFKELSINSIVIPSGMSSLDFTITIEATHSLGTLYIDDFQLYPSGHKSSYNYIENGYFDNVTSSLPQDFTFTNFTSSDYLTEINYGEPFNNVLGEKVLRVSGSKYVLKTIQKIVNLSGNALDKFTFNIWVKCYKSVSETLKVDTTFTYPGFNSEIFTLNFKDFFNEWQLGSIGVAANKPYTAITIKLSYQGESILYVDALSLTRDSYGVHFNYDEQANILEQASLDSSSSLEYENNRISSSTSTNGLTFKYQYNIEGKPTKIIDNFSNKAEFSYDSRGNRTISKITDINNKFLQFENTYNLQNKPITTKDELGNVTSYTYNTDGILYKVTHPNDLITTNTYDKFNNLLQQINSKGSQSNTNSFQYNLDSSLKKIICENGNQYNFEYDSFKRLLNVKIGGEFLVKYEYNDIRNGIKRDNITKQTNGSNGDSYSFSYNDSSQLTEVFLNSSSLYKYEYDEFGNIIKISGTDFVKYFSYDNDTKLIRETSDDGKNIYFEYDNLKNIQKIFNNINGFSRSEDYEYSYEYNEYNSDSYKSRIDYAFNDDFIDYNIAYTGIYGARPRYYGVSKDYDNILKRDICTLDKYKSTLRYDLTTINKYRKFASGTKSFNYSAWKMDFQFRKTFYGWFKFESLSTLQVGTKILSFGIDSDDSCFVTVSPSGQNYLFKLNVKNGSVVTQIGSNKTVSSSSPYVFIALKCNAEGSSASTLELYINDLAPVTGTTNLFAPSSLNILVIGDRNSSGLSTQASPFKESVVIASIGSYEYSEMQFKLLYEQGKKYLINDEVHYPKTGVSYINQETYDNMDVVTLNGTVSFNSGLKPISLTYADSSFKIDKPKLFEYDSLSKKHVYGSYSKLMGLGDSIGKLVYKLPLTTSGTIGIVFKINNSSSGYRTIFSFQNTSNEILSYKVRTNNGVVLVYNGTSISINRNIELMRWYKLVVSFTNGYIKTYFDDDYVISTSATINLNNCSLAVGCKLALNGYTPEEHLEGNLELLSYTDNYLFQTNINQIYSLLGNKHLIRVYNELDGLSRISKDRIKSRDNSNDLVHTYNYYAPASNKTSLRVASVTRSFNSSVDNYLYDSMGNITSITKSEGAYLYQYDFLNRLIEEKNPVSHKRITYTYGLNNNISVVRYYNLANNILEETYNYIYDTIWKDKLVSITKTINGGATTTEYSLLYNGSFIGNPSSINGTSLTYQGRRLINVGNITFAYDEQGNRISKTGNGNTTNYFYVGNKLLSLTKGNNRLYFHYNEKGLVVGFEYNKQNYFYLRDLTGNITNIINDLGTSVVSYKYDAWGKWINQSNASNGQQDGDILVEINPYLYKGYIFDSETGWYYLKTRFYIPELRRFLNNDDTKFIDKNDMSTFNLFVYCGNNPVMLMDGSGNSPVPWWSWVISGAQLALGIGLMFVPGAQGFAAGLMIGGSLGLIANAASPAVGQAIGGASSIANGWGAFSTGMSILGLGQIGLIGGIGLMAIGGATMAFGVNEIASSVTGNNYIQQLTGMSDSAYGWTYIGLNVASSVGQIAGRSYHLRSTREVRLSHDSLSTKGYRYSDMKGRPLYDFDYPHENIRYNHYHGWQGPKLTGRTRGHWSYTRLIWWLLTGR
ncbi:MAG: hypothetical protein LBV58_01485 [Acholeplasmatales bacterium]|jgi:RHS repeat-associated protein|nr:hypothetical protein [Acholeplasmatales bacterium]